MWLLHNDFPREFEFKTLAWAEKHTDVGRAPTKADDDSEQT